MIGKIRIVPMKDDQVQITPLTPHAQKLMNEARRLEATFLSQMLAHAGLDQSVAAMGGGDGAAQFASFLRDAQAESMVQAGGIGLSESLFRALTTRTAEGSDAT